MEKPTLICDICRYEIQEPRWTFIATSQDTCVCLKCYQKVRLLKGNLDPLEPQSQDEPTHEADSTDSHH